MKEQHITELKLMRFSIRPSRFFGTTQRLGLETSQLLEADLMMETRPLRISAPARAAGRDPQNSRFPPRPAPAVSAALGNHP